MRVLLEGGANIETGDIDKMTALHYAAIGGHLDMCRVLLDWGANVDPVNNLKNTPLHLVAKNGTLSVVKLLVERVADVGLKNEDGLTASDLAREAGYKNVAEWLDSVSSLKRVTCTKHIGNYMYRTCTISAFWTHRLHLCAPCNPHNKQQLFYPTTHITTSL
jgi:hypothetical protein